LALAILIDVSGSQNETLPDEKGAARAFIDAVVRPERDKAAVVSFHSEATIEQDLTGDTTALHRAIGHIEMPRLWTDKEQVEFVLSAEARGESGEQARYRIPGWSAIWDAVWATTGEIMAQAPERSRRAVILLSDGDENFNSPLKKDDVIEAALKNDTVIYCIGIGSESLDEGALKRIAERTGGRAFFPEDERQLNAAFAQIQQELRSQYLLAYTPTNKARDSSYRKLRLEIVNPELRKAKLKLSYRQGYFARAAALPPAPARSDRRTLAKPPRKRKQK
ncbi:MAG: VWA domain-containing protein, partial [Pyrinomonadaceae bacterium]